MLPYPPLSLVPGAEEKKDEAPSLLLGPPNSEDAAAATFTPPTPTPAPDAELPPFAFRVEGGKLIPPPPPKGLDGPAESKGEAPLTMVALVNFLGTGAGTGAGAAEVLVENGEGEGAEVEVEVGAEGSLGDGAKELELAGPNSSLAAAAFFTGVVVFFTTAAGYALPTLPLAPKGGGAGAGASNGPDEDTA